MYLKKGDDNFAGVKGCVLCRVGNEPSSNSTKIHRHHLYTSQTDKYGNKNGRTIKLCSSHHGQLHGFIKREMEKKILKTEPYFFKDCLCKMMKQGDKL